jgi:hypothetical protein
MMEEETFSVWKKSTASSLVAKKPSNVVAIHYQLTSGFPPRSW